MSRYYQGQDGTQQWWVEEEPVIEERVVVDVRPVMETGFDRQQMAESFLAVIEWAKNRRFIVGFVLGFVVAFAALDASLVNMRDTCSAVDAENKELAARVEELTAEVEKGKGEV